jgi:prepilin-type N-terminal cleavage/methylation domain-containing protein
LYYLIKIIFIIMLSRFKNKESGPARTFTRIFSKGGCFKGGFTLLEILLVVGIIAILAGIVIIAINPSKQLATVRNTERKSDIRQIESAIIQYYIDNSRYPDSLTGDLTEICDTGSLSTTTGSPIDCTGLIDLTPLVPTYITAIPNDPGTTTTAGYSAMLVNKQPTVSAPLAELGVTISVGTDACAGSPAVGTTCLDGTIYVTSMLRTTPSDAGITHWHAAVIYCMNTERTGGYADWYLPAQDELNTLYINRVAIGHFDTSDNYLYWSSTEAGYDPDPYGWDLFAWNQAFNDGSQFGINVNHSRSVRCVRRP